MKKKVNPRRKPATQADVERARAEAMGDAVKFAWAIVFTALCDKEGWNPMQLKRLWAEVEKLSVEVSEDRVSVADMIDILKREYGVTLT